MPGPYSEIVQPRVIPTYAPLDMSAFTNALGIVRQRYDKNVDQYNALTALQDSLDVGDNVTAQGIKQQAITGAREGIQSYLDKGNLEDAALDIAQMGRNFSGNEELLGVMRGYKDYQTAREVALKNPGRTVDFANYQTHKFKNEDGTFNPYTSSQETLLEHDNKKFKMYSTIKETGWWNTLSESDKRNLDGYLGYTKTTGIDKKRGQEILAKLAEEYIKTEEGQQEVRLLNKANSRNEWQPIIENISEAEEAVKQEFIAGGQGIIGTNSTPGFVRDYGSVTNTGNGGGPSNFSNLVTAPMQRDFYSEGPKQGKMHLDKGASDKVLGAKVTGDKYLTPGSVGDPGQMVLEGQLSELFRLEKSGVELPIDQLVDLVTGNYPVEGGKYVQERPTPVIPEGTKGKWVELEGGIREFIPDNPGDIPSDFERQTNPNAPKYDELTVNKSVKKAMEILGVETPKEILPKYEELKNKNIQLTSSVEENAEKIGIVTKKMPVMEFFPIDDGEDNIVTIDGKSYQRGYYGAPYATWTTNLGASTANDLMDREDGVVKQIEAVDGDVKDIYGIPGYRPVNINPGFWAGVEKYQGVGSDASDASILSDYYTNEGNADQQYNQAHKGMSETIKQREEQQAIEMYENAQKASVLLKEKAASLDAGELNTFWSEVEADKRTYFSEYIYGRGWNASDLSSEQRMEAWAYANISVAKHLKK